jgi:hypothetical protein
MYVLLESHPELIAPGGMVGAHPWAPPRPWYPALGWPTLRARLRHTLGRARHRVWLTT